MKEKKNLVFLILAAILLVTLACQALFPTPEPTAVPTPIPTEEPTPIPPTEPASEAKPEAEEAEAESSAEVLSDGTTKFSDYQGGYELVFPENWFLSNLNDLSMDEAVDAAKDANPDIPEGLLNMGMSMLTEGSGFFAIDTNEGHYDGTKMTAAFAVQNEAFGVLPLDFLVNTTAQSLPQQLPDAEIRSSGVETNAQGVEMGMIEVVLPINDAAGNTTSVYERMLFIQGNEITTMMILLSDESLLPIVSDHLDQIQNSITLLP